MGLINEIENNILHHFYINYNIRPHEFARIINAYGFPVQKLIILFEKFYNETQKSRNINIKICFYVKRILNELNKLKYKETIYLTDLLYIIGNLINCVHHEILIRAPDWYQKHSKNNYEYWAFLLNVNSNTFNYFKNSQGRVIDGDFNPLVYNKNKFTEFYIKSINKWNFIKFTRKDQSNFINIFWSHTHYHDWFINKICNNIFYDKGGVLCKLFYQKQNKLQTIDGKETIIDKFDINNNTFIEALIQNSKHYQKFNNSDYRQIETPWGLVKFNINNLQHSQNISQFITGILI